MNPDPEMNQWEMLREMGLDEDTMLEDSIQKEERDRLEYIWHEEQAKEQMARNAERIRKFAERMAAQRQRAKIDQLSALQEAAKAEARDAKPWKGKPLK